MFIFVLFVWVFSVYAFLYLIPLFDDRSVLVSFGFRSKHIDFFMNLIIFLRFVFIDLDENS